MTRAIAVVDGDIIAFRAAAANEVRSVKAVHKVTKEEISCAHRTALKEQIKGAFLLEEFDIVDVQTPECISHAIHSLKSTIERLKGSCGTGEIEIYLGGKNNFRDSLPLPTKYKFGREKDIRPVQLKGLREYLVEHQGAIIVDNYESDDKLAMRCYEGLRQGIKTIACTLDGDQNGVEGYMYNWNKHSEPFLVKGLGTIDLNDKRNDFDGYGRKFFYAQWVFGDWGTDKFKPCEIAKKKFGVVAMYNLLKDCKSDKECVEAVYKQYLSWYPDEHIEYVDWTGQQQKKTVIELMDMYAACAHMKRFEDDVFSTEKLFKNLGINYD